jgi:hypothetical protein
MRSGKVKAETMMFCQVFPFPYLEDPRSLLSQLLIYIYFVSKSIFVNSFGLGWQASKMGYLADEFVSSLCWI